MVPARISDDLPAARRPEPGPAGTPRRAERVRSGRRARRPLALAAVLLAACRSGPDPDTPTLRFASRADVTGIFPNPPTNNEAYTMYVNRNVFESLVTFDPRLRLEPALAGRWENPDERTYVFDLRPDLVFSDGTPVTAHDAAASLEAARRRNWPNRDYLQAIESVRALDEHRVQIRTREPYFILLFKLPFGFVLPASAVGAQPVPPIGTGPYRLAAWSPGSELVLEANPRYRGPAPAYPRARFLVVPDASRRLEQVLAGEADVADQVPYERLEGLRRDTRVQVIERPGLRVLYLCLRVDRPPFSDPRVRQAVDLALDRGDLSRRALAGRAEPATQIVPPAVVGHDSNIAATLPDPAAARALLAAAGHPDGLDVVLDGPSNRYVNDEQILAEIARQLGEVGIRARVRARDKVAFFDAIDNGRSNMHLVGWACESGDAGDVLDAVMHSPGRDALGSFNTMGLADAELDRLIDAANRSRDNIERTQRLQQAVRRVAELRVTLPLVIETEAFVLSRNVVWSAPVTLAYDLTTFRPRAPREAPAP